MLTAFFVFLVDPIVNLLQVLHLLRVKLDVLAELLYHVVVQLVGALLKLKPARQHVLY